MHSRSASWVANQSKKPLRAAERTPLALKLMMRMGEEPGLGIGDWGLGNGHGGMRVWEWGSAIRVRGGGGTEGGTRLASLSRRGREQAAMPDHHGPHTHAPPRPSKGHARARYPAGPPNPE